MTKYPHYFKEVVHLDYLDVYRVLALFDIHRPAVQHAIKKLLCAGGRGGKDYRKDITEARDSLTRELQMLDEDAEESGESGASGCR